MVSDKDYTFRALDYKENFMVMMRLRIHSLLYLGNIFFGASDIENHPASQKIICFLVSALIHFVPFE